MEGSLEGAPRTLTVENTVRSGRSHERKRKATRRKVKEFCLGRRGKKGNGFGSHVDPTTILDSLLNFRPRVCAAITRRAFLKSDLPVSMTTTMVARVRIASRRHGIFHLRTSYALSASIRFIAFIILVDYFSFFSLGSPFAYRYTYGRLLSRSNQRTVVFLFFRITPPILFNLREER